MSETDWTEVGVGGLLPTGTVTLLLADVEGSTRLWQTRPEDMTDAVARLDHILADVVAAHGGVRPVEQGEGDSFVIAFARASDAAACAIALQRASLAPIALRIALHTGEIQLRDAANYVGPTINRTARLRELAHGGQTIMSSTSADLVVDSLPQDAYLTDLGVHPLRDLPRPERVTQLGHPDLPDSFPPLRTSESAAEKHLPSQFTSLIGRVDELDELRRIVSGSRLVTLTGSGGVGKTRLAIELGSRLTADFDAIAFVDLAPITDPAVVSIAVVRALGLSDHPSRSTMSMLARHIGERAILIILDNCEHLLDAGAALTTELFNACPRVRILATSREPINVPGEVTWQVPSLPVEVDAVSLFIDRAQLTRPGFLPDEQDLATITDICRRLDGIPLAIELAAARVRSLSPSEILDGLRDRFRLLTGGARTSLQRQQTLRASVDWSHALLTDAERTLFRRLAAFMGGFDLDAAQVVAGVGDVEPHHVLDQLSLLVDKSLVVASDIHGRTRYRMLETVRQYAQEKLGDSGEAHPIRQRHRDHYLSRALTLGEMDLGAARWRVSRAELDMDNLRAAFEWSRDEGDVDSAARLASALWPLWVSRGRLREASGWFEAALADHAAGRSAISPAAWARAVSDKVMVDGMAHTNHALDDAEQALSIARDVGDPILIARALTACASTATVDPEPARRYTDEAVEVARAANDASWLAQVLAWQCSEAYAAGDPVTARASGAEGHALAAAIGDRFVSRACRWAVTWAEQIIGDVATAAEQFRQLSVEAAADNDLIWTFSGLWNRLDALARSGEGAAATDAVRALLEVADELGGRYRDYLRIAEAMAAMATDDLTQADHALTDVWPRLPVGHAMTKMNLWRRAVVALDRRDMFEARRWADTAVAVSTGWHLANAHAVRSGIALAQGDPATAEEDAHLALAALHDMGAQLGVADALECLAGVAASDDVEVSARLLGAADAVRRRSSAARMPTYQADYETVVAVIRNALGDQFDAKWAEGAALSTSDAIAYARRGRGERKRPSSGWAALTPAELDVIKLVCEGLPNKEIASRLFVSPRTVQAHLTHTYAKLDIASRAQLIQLSAQRA